MDIGEIKYLEQPAKVLKLSEAIRIGAKIRGEHRGTWTDQFKGTSCAVAAAAEAIGVPFKYCGEHEITYPALAHACFLGDTPNQLLVKAFQMHDSGMSREAVADRLEAMGY